MVSERTEQTQSNSLLAQLRRARSLPLPDRTGQRWGFGAFFLASAVFVLSAILIGAIVGTGEVGTSPSAVLALVITVVPSLLTAALVIAITLIRGSGPVIDLRLTVTAADLKIGLKLGLLGILSGFLAVWVWNSTVGSDSPTSTLDDLAKNGNFTPVTALIMFVYICFIGPLCEELLFRGMLWGAMERLRWGPWITFVLTTLIFAVSHLEPKRMVLLIVAAVPIGLARLITQRVTASVVAHMINNLIPGIVFLLITIGAIPA